MRSLYIHVGQPKTGTSSIQRFLVDNREALLAAGLGIGPYMTLASGKSLPLRRAIETQGLAAAMAAVAASPGERLVISSEHFNDALVSDARAGALRDAAAAAGLRPVAVVFLRRQDFWHESLYTQQVKTFYQGSIEAYTEAAIVDGAEYDYDAGVARLERVFGPDGVRVLLFHETGPRDVVGDFLAATGTRLDRGAAREAGRQNRSPHRRKVLFLGQVPKPDPAIQDLSGLMTEVVQASGAIEDDGERFLLPPEGRRRLLATYARGNRALVDRYGLDHRGHFAEPPEAVPADWAPPRPISPRERRAVLHEAMRACTRLRGHPRYRLRMAGKVAALYVRMRSVPE